jgi:hypothetical protein
VFSLHSHSLYFQSGEIYQTVIKTVIKYSCNEFVSELATCSQCKYRKEGRGKRRKKEEGKKMVKIFTK